VDSGLGNRYYYIPLRKGFLYLVARCGNLFSRGMFSAGNFPTALTWKFCLGALKIALTVGRKPTDLPLRSRVSVHLGDFVARLKTEEIKISWSGRGRCFTTTSWWRDLWRKQSNMRRCTCAPTSDAWGS